jgi:hypothetical protein
MKRVREDGLSAMNDTTLAQMLKRIRKHGKGNNGNGSSRK